MNALLRDSTGLTTQYILFFVDSMPTSTHTNRMKLYDIVKYITPQKGEEDLHFVLREINGDRVLIELICDWAIKPTEVVAISEVCKADA